MPSDSPTKTLLILSQVYVPDHASVGQHMADAATEMARRGYRVVVLAANRGYNDPSMKYPPSEVLDGVEVLRIPLSSFGKKSIPMRLLASASFLIQCVLRGVFTRRLACVLVSTSPPMCSAAALIIAAIRGARVKYWVMDLNPDQMIAMGWINASSPIVKLFDWFNRMVLRRASDIITLDRFMAERVLRKLDVREKLHVMPPWPHDDHLEPVRHEDNPFRKQHNLQGKFVIMYSGNHSIVHPVTTLLEAAVQLKHERRLVFMFVGGGLAKMDVERTIQQHNPGNIISLPYQPLAELKYSLSAADVHAVSVGTKMVGIVHPCKVYGAMAAARPLLLLGPSPCHASEIIERNEIGWRIVHGDVAGAVATIRTILSTAPQKLAEIGRRAQRIVSTQLSKDLLCGKFCDVLESEVNTTHASAV
ncbi:MAG: glycosyltransferase family 4 protein [Planctomycetes bacterium]|nr:glycosyltransferase family 4 protein [Planctomycetota bacterium]